MNQVNLLVASCQKSPAALVSGMCPAGANLHVAIERTTHIRIWSHMVNDGNFAPSFLAWPGLFLEVQFATFSLKARDFAYPSFEFSRRHRPTHA